MVCGVWCVVCGVVGGKDRENEMGEEQMGKDDTYGI